ncbi:Glycosyl hydrolases family 28 [Chitinophaga jiangningensis]|uniref:Glycosyl hydrolases family 28 n=2 Tax=Chitinophaga jiangningensis TaxID=1419482 RepID=A0A1M7J9R6_9BACT|nr:Glycosyl hydrolases family 28 [Chitinophaga jiangningensis]
MNKERTLTSLTGIIICALFSVVCTAQSQLVVYPFPGPEAGNKAHNGDFTVKVRTPGGKWQDMYEYNVKVDEVRGIDHHVENASMAAFDFSGEVEVSVTSNTQQVREAAIRPLSYGIAYTMSNNTVYFRLQQPKNISVEINGDKFHNLHLFANPVQTDIPDVKDKNVIYYGPGFHEIKGGVLQVTSGKSVYLAGGAVIMGRIEVDSARDVQITGRGIIVSPQQEGVKISYTKNVLVEGICLTQCPVGSSDSVTVRNVKSISSHKWGDGMNVFASNNVLYDRVFCRNSDDCSTVYATRKGYTGGCRNIVMQHSTLWADVAHPVHIGLHGNTPAPDTIEGIHYRDIDILEHQEKQVDYQGCMAINAGDNNLVKDVTFEDIRIESIRCGQIVHLQIPFNKKYCTAPGRGIENVLFKNVTYNGSNPELSIITGYSKDRRISNVVFENLRVNGVLISDDMKGKPGWYKTADMARMFVGEFVDGLVFKKTTRN